MRVITSLALLAILPFLPAAPSLAHGREYQRVFFFGSVPLAANERIVGIDISVTGARFQSIILPYAWEVDAHGPVGDMGLTARCTQAESSFDEIHRLDGFFVIAAENPSAIHFSATLHIGKGFEHSTERKLTSSQLFLHEI